MISRGGPWRIADRLGARLAFLLAVALLPLGVISVVQSQAVMHEAAARSEAALTGETMRAAEHELQALQQAQGAAAALARAVVPLAGDPVACSAMLAAVAADAPTYAVVGLIGPDRRMVCSSVGHEVDLADSPTVPHALAAGGPLLQVNPNGKVSGTAVVVASHPVRGSEGQALGVIAISLPHAALVTSAGSGSGVTPTVLMTFNGQGDVLTSSVGLAGAAAMLPRERTLQALAGTRSLAFTGTTRNGDRRVFSVAPIVPGAFYALGSWAPDGGASVWLRPLPSFVLPSLMWLGCLVVAWLAAEQLMTRHIRALRKAILSFAKGSRLVDPLDFSTAPREIRDLAEAFERMTETILHDEAELEDTVHQKEVLLREVHHRVKNNLQLIASIMNMQIRQARTPEAKGLMKGLQDRVMSLATVHRGLYQTTGLTDIRADELLADIVRQVVALGSGRGRQIAVRTDFGGLSMTPDQAVPLALLLTEALSNVMKHAGAAPGDEPRLEVSLRRDGPGWAVLEVANTVAEPPASAEPQAQDHAGTMGTGLGAQILTGFAQQVGGEVQTGIADGLHVLRLRFKLRPLEDAEARNAPLASA